MNRGRALDTVCEKVLERGCVAVNLIVDALLSALESVAVAPVRASRRVGKCDGGKVAVDVSVTKVVGNGENLGEGETVSTWFDEGEMEDLHQ